MGENLAAVDLGRDQRAVAIATGAFHSCALLTTGKVKCWGESRHSSVWAIHICFSMQSIEAFQLYGFCHCWVVLHALAVFSSSVPLPEYIPPASFHLYRLILWFFLFPIFLQVLFSDYRSVFIYWCCLAGELWTLHEQYAFAVMNHMIIPLCRETKCSLFISSYDGYGDDVHFPEHRVDVIEQCLS